MIFHAYLLNTHEKYEKYIIYLYLKFVALYSGLHVSRIGFVYLLFLFLYIFILQGTLVVLA